MKKGCELWVAGRELRFFRRQSLSVLLATHNSQLVTQKSILAEIEMHRCVSTEGIFHKAPAAIVAQVQPRLVVDFVADFIVGVVVGVVVEIVEAFQDFLDFLQMVSIVVRFVFQRIEGRVDFQSDDVSKLVGCINSTFAAIAGVVNHYTISLVALFP